MKHTSLFYRIGIGIIGVVASVLDAVILGVMIAVFYVIETVARFGRAFTVGTEVGWRSYRPLAYVVKAVTNLYKAAGRTYCWQAGVKT